MLEPLTPRPDREDDPAALVMEADRLEVDGRRDDAIELLTNANRRLAAAPIELRLARLRHAVFADLDPHSEFATWPPEPRAKAGHAAASLPQLAGADLDAESVRANVVAHGCVLAPRLVPEADVDRLVQGIDEAFAVWGGLRRPFARPTGSPWFDPLPLDDASKASLGRTWVTNGAGILTVDSPRMLYMLLDVFERLGLRAVVTDYLGERPVLSANKCTLRRVPVETNAGWHQDGAFLGSGIRALNVWLALSACGVDAPGLDIVPRRFDHIVETGSHGSYFDWAVGPELVDQIAESAPITRPEFRAGDVLFFDDMLLHRTATEARMTKPRYAIETWFFAASHYPEGHVPLVW
jgi:hypothetical protein